VEDNRVTKTRIIQTKNRLPRESGEYTVLVNGEKQQAWFIARKGFFVTLDGADGVDCERWIEVLQ
jgi:hypothetical protein